jgi:hypothetical protein
VESLVPKLILTPLLVGFATLAGRRWGPGVSGWLVGIPFTSGPVALFVSLGQGPSFGAAVAAGTLAGTISQAMFCLTYIRLGGWDGWPLALATSSLAFAAVTLVLQQVALPLLLACIMVALALLVSLRMTHRSGAKLKARPAPAPRWDLPVRMLIATSIVVGLTSVAPLLGPRLTGLLSPYPIYGATLAVFAHRLDGPAPAAGILRGLLLGLFGFAGFFAVLSALLERVGVALAFAAALATVLLIQAISLWVLRQRA